MTLLCCLTFTDPAGDLRTIWSAPKAAALDDVPGAIAPALARIRRECGVSVTLAVTDDVTGACLLRARLRERAVPTDLKPGG